MLKQELLYGVAAEFNTAEELLGAARRAYQAGYRKLDAYSPFPIEGLSEAVGCFRTRLPLIVFIGGVVGCCGGFFLQWWPNVIGYPLNIGGKPYDSWPAFIPITFELTILFAALSAAFGMLALNGLPHPYHPMFNLARFAEVTKDSFFLAIFAEDPMFDREKTTAFLKELNPLEVQKVEN